VSESLSTTTYEGISPFIREKKSSEEPFRNETGRQFTTLFEHIRFLSGKK